MLLPILFFDILGDLLLWLDFLDHKLWLLWSCLTLLICDLICLRFCFSPTLIYMSATLPFTCVKSSSNTKSNCLLPIPLWLGLLLKFFKDLVELDSSLDVLTLLSFNNDELLLDIMDLVELFLKKLCLTGDDELFVDEFAWKVF